MCFICFWSKWKERKSREELPTPDGPPNHLCNYHVALHGTRSEGVGTVLPLDLQPTPGFQKFYLDQKRVGRAREFGNGDVDTVKSSKE